MSGEVPDGWRTGTMGDLIREAVSRTGQGAELQGCYLGLEHIGQGTGRLSGVGKASDAASQKSIFQAGDILYGKLRPNLRKVARPNFGGICSTDIVVFRAGNDADPDFAFQVLQSESLIAHAVATAAGTKMPRTHARSITSFEIMLPPLAEQRRIAEVLRSVDEATEAQEEVCRQLSVAFTSTLEACFTAAEWPAYRLGDLCESIQVGIVVKPAAYYVESGGVPALRSLNVLENRLALDDLVYISEAGHRANQKSSLRAGDVVTRRTGEPGKTAMIPSGFEEGLNCIDIIFSRPKDCLRSAYLSFFMNSKAAKRQVAALQGGLAQQHLNVGEMKKLVLPLPDLQAQDQTVGVLAEMSVSVDASRHALRKLSALKLSIASDLLSGRVRLPA